jgi:hypothetical protein
VNDETKVHAWNTLAPLARQATQILEAWRKYSRQVDRLNELQQTAKAACARGAYAQEDDEPHWAIVRRINGLRSEQAAICHRAATVLLELEDVLPLDKVEALEREISPASIRRTCQGIVTAAKHFNEHCGPAPAGWPGSSDGDTNMLLEDSVINALKMQVKEMETRQQEIDAAEQKRFADEQAEAKRKAENQKKEGALDVHEFAGKLCDEARLHEPAYVEASGAEVALPALLKQICKKKEIKTDSWLRNNHIDRSQFYVWKHAGGKQVEGKVSVEMADKIKAAILRDAARAG